MSEPKVDESVNRNGACSKPYNPDNPCDKCQNYWDRMRAEGYWVDGEGWTEKAREEWNK